MLTPLKDTIKYQKLLMKGLKYQRQLIFLIGKICRTAIEYRVEQISLY